MRKYIRPLLASAVAALVGAALYWVLDTERLNGNALTTVGTLAAAFATAVAAVAAMRAAQQSDATAKNALEALGLAMEPDVRGYVQFTRLSKGSEPDREVALLTVQNSSVWPAVDVEAQVDLSDGRRFTHHWPRIDGTATTNLTYPRTPTTVEIEVPGRFVKHLAAGDGQDLLHVDRVMLRYSDERHALRWELVTEQRNSDSLGDGVRSGGYEVLHDRRRIR